MKHKKILNKMIKILTQSKMVSVKNFSHNYFSKKIRGNPRYLALARICKIFFLRKKTTPTQKNFYSLSLVLGNLFFVQIGSNDGVSGDPLRKNIIEFNWSGIFVEPLHQIFLKLKKNYSFADRFYFENSAIDKNSNRKIFWFLADSFYKNGRDWHSQIGSFEISHLEKHKNEIPDFEFRISSKLVQCITFSELCEKYHILNLDILHIDAEGYDFEIIKTIDFKTIRPFTILFETKHLQEQEKREAYNYLNSFGYSIMDLNIDSLATLRSKQFLYFFFLRFLKYIKK